MSWYLASGTFRGEHFCGELFVLYWISFVFLPIDKDKLLFLMLTWYVEPLSGRECDTWCSFPVKTSLAVISCVKSCWLIEPESRSTGSRPHSFGSAFVHCVHFRRIIRRELFHHLILKCALNRVVSWWDKTRQQEQLTCDPSLILLLNHHSETCFDRLHCVKWDL